MVKVIKKLKTTPKPKKKVKKALIKKPMVKVAKKKPKPKPKLKPKTKTKLKTKAKPKLKQKTKAKPKSKKVVSKKRVKKIVKVKLEKHINNPIIVPSFYPWESKATFNPTAFQVDGKVHIIYRAIGENDSSVLGYASSYDGLNIEERPTHSIYQRFGSMVKIGDPIEYISGGGWGGGCEDPRVTLIDDTLYMLYTAFDGWGSVRIAMTSIALADFKKKRWNWEKPVMISPPGQIHKNWVLFPEKINGKFAILHSISPEIGIDYVSSLKEFDGNKFINSVHTSKAPWKDSWDNMVRGVGPAPIKTSIGWLVLYHSMDRNDPDRYKLGAMILDSKNPKKILYHSNHPILEPDLSYENEGYKWGVIYSCGAVVKDGTLFVYYGGADKFTAVASIPLKVLLESLKKDKFVKLKNNKILK